MDDARDQYTLNKLFEHNAHTFHYSKVDRIGESVKLNS
jgi:5-keto 4-deoxyuronate isomerase